jgi:Pyridoxamine 5'-phosphate oxidase
VAAAPELARVADERIDSTGILLLGTIRADGRPRISPCEPYVVDGELLLGMMWQSRKALDLLRDPRLTLATPQASREAVGGDLKLYGTAAGVEDEGRRTAYGDATQARIGWRPAGPFHLFEVDIESAGFISFGSDRRLLRWASGSGVEVLRHPDQAGGAGGAGGADGA